MFPVASRRSASHASPSSGRVRRFLALACGPHHMSHYSLRLVPADSLLEPISIKPAIGLPSSQALQLCFANSS